MIGVMSLFDFLKQRNQTVPAINDAPKFIQSRIAKIILNSRNAGNSPNTSFPICIANPLKMSSFTKALKKVKAIICSAKFKPLNGTSGKLAGILTWLEVKKYHPPPNVNEMHPPKQI